MQIASTPTFGFSHRARSATGPPPPIRGSGSRTLRPVSLPHPRARKRRGIAAPVTQKSEPGVLLRPEGKKGALPTRCQTPDICTRDRSSLVWSACLTVASFSVHTHLFLFLGLFPCCRCRILSSCCLMSVVLFANSPSPLVGRAPRRSVVSLTHPYRGHHMAASRTAYSFLGSSRVVCILGVAFGLGWGPWLGRGKDGKRKSLVFGGFRLGSTDWTACEGRSNKAVHGGGGGGGRLGLLLIPPFCLWELCGGERAGDGAMDDGMRIELSCI